MSNTHAVHGPMRDHGFGTPTGKIAWVAGALAVLYAIGVAQYLSPFKVVGLGAPTVVGLFAGACGLLAIMGGQGRSWMAWLGVSAGVLAVVLTLLLV